MNRIVRKDTGRMIRATLGRFLSITAIVIIGVAFFVGISASPIEMGYSIDKYDDAQKLKDITVYSNYGFDEEDVKAIQGLENIEKVEPAQFVDVVAGSNATSIVTRVHSFKEGNEINQFVLKSGRLPENENECLAEEGSDLQHGFDIGDTITLTRPDNDLEDYLSVNKVKVVGTVDTPVYLNQSRESSTLSNQGIMSYLYVPESTFVTDYYLEVNCIVKNAEGMNSFSDEYYDYVDAVKEEVEDLAKTQQQHRHDEILAEANDKYEDGLKDYEEGLSTYQSEISDAEQQIQDNEQKLIDGQAQIEDAKQQLVSSQQELDQAKVDGYAKLQDSINQLDEASAQLQKQEQDFNTKKEEYNQNILDIQDGISKIDTAIPSLQQSITGIQQIQQLQQILNQSETILQMVTPYQTILGEDATVEQFEQAILNDPNQTDETKQQTIQLIEGNIQALQQVFTVEDSVPQIVKLSDYAKYLQLYQSQQQVIQDKLTGNITTIYAQINQANGLTADAQIQTTEGIEALITSLNQQKEQLNQTIVQIQDGIASGEKQIEDAKAQIKDGYVQAETGKQTLETEIANGQAKIDESYQTLAEKQKEIDDGNAEIAQAKADLEQAKIDGQKELDDAKIKLEDAKDEIADLDQGEWTVLNRKEHYASVSYQNTIDQMNAIASIFPVFFFLVAALVCLTTMTRMVAEQRGQIGILRALGYSRHQCMSKYLVYAGTATLVGCIIGDIVGLLVFPAIIYHAWGMMYINPAYYITIPWNLIFIADGSFLLIILATTYFACLEDMREVSAQLMRPKSPKIGKKILLEKIPFIWKHLSFTWKVTIRNLFRYKKRFVMTVIGVAGCTALMITGFGIRDSIETIAHTQFEEIYKYDGTASFSTQLTEEERLKEFEIISNKSVVSDTEIFYSYNGTVSNLGVDDTTATVQVFHDADEINHLYELRQRANQKPISLTDDGVVISEKLAKNLDKKVGDEISLEDEDGKRVQVKITGICEMYVRHYVFMTETYYESLFGTTKEDNMMSIQVKNSDAITPLKSELTDSSAISKIDFHDELLNNFNHMIQGLDYIVIVIIVSSAALAAVVLGNLTNVNISERMREIATLKVLGFRRKEVENYIYKENNVLTLIGSLVGIPLGIWLHHTIMSLVEMEYIMFGRQISFFSFAICIGMTLLFGMLVNLCMRKKLTNIQMVESLKSVE